MKRIGAIIMAALVLITSVNAVLAASYGNGIVSTKIGVVINGQKMRFDTRPVVKNDRMLIPVRAVSEAFGATVDWDAGTKSFKITNENMIIGMKIGDKNYRVNSQQMTMDVEPVLLNGVSMVPLRFLAEALGVKVTWDAQYNVVGLGDYVSGRFTSDRGGERSQYKVVIDPGHGGAEPGASYGGVDEKTLNLDISMRLNELLKSEGIQTVMTRTNDVYLGLYPRSELANNVNADLLVSVHNNAGGSRTTGSMTLYYPGSANSNGNLGARDFAEIVQRHLVNDLGANNLGVIQRPNLAVLRTANMPAVIAEVGYMSNNYELGRLKTGEYRQRAAEALKNAVLEALDRI